MGPYERVPRAEELHRRGTQPIHDPPRVRVGFRRTGFGTRDSLNGMNTATPNTTTPSRHTTRHGLIAAIVTVSLSLGLVVAGETARLLESPKMVGGVMYAATQEILLVVPSLRSKEVADSLRRAATERGTVVYILADASLIEERASYLPGLSLLKGNVQVRLLRGLRTGQAVVDRKLLLSGPLLVDIPNPLEPGRTEASTSLTDINRSINWFGRAWKQARPYSFRADPPKRKTRP